MTDRVWMLSAACRGADPSLFKPRRIRRNSTTSHPQVQQALRYCAVCPVVAECDAYAASKADYPMAGVWGGRYVTNDAAEHRRQARKQVLEGAHDAR